MARYKLLVMTAPKPGMTAEYNHWYDHVHLVEMCLVPGFMRAERFRLRPTPAADAPGITFVSTGLEYLAIYDVETDNLESTLATLNARLTHMTLSDSTETQVMAEFFEPLPISSGAC